MLHRRKITSSLKLKLNPSYEKREIIEFFCSLYFFSFLLPESNFQGGKTKNNTSHPPLPRLLSALLPPPPRPDNKGGISIYIFHFPKARRWCIYCGPANYPHWANRRMRYIQPNIQPQILARVADVERRITKRSRTKRKFLIGNCFQKNDNRSPLVPQGAVSDS